MTISEESRRKMSLAKKGKPLVFSEEYRKKLEARRLLRVATAAAYAAWRLEHAAELALEKRRKLSESNKGRIAWNKGVQAWNKGEWWLDEVREHISEGMRRYWQRRKQAKAKELEASQQDIE